MGLQRATWVIAAAVLVSGCIPRTYPTAAPSADRRQSASDAVAEPLSAQAVASRPLTPAERQVRELEAQLAERDRAIAAVQAELASARQQPGRAAGATAGSAAPPAGADQGAAAGATGGSATMAAALAAKDAELADARQQIAALETQMESEIRRRQQVEGQMARVLEETSSGPYEHSANVIDQHLREQLSSAQEEIADLHTTLETERKERADLERRYGALQQQLERAGRGSENDSEEVTALKERQRRVLASIRQDLAASQQRESELRAALTEDSADGVSLADSVTSLRAENAALQRRLDDEHRQNRELASKLKLAGRVTDLIFKMQSTGGTTAAAVPQ